MKSTLVALTALITFALTGPCSHAADKKEAVAVFYTVELFIKFENSDGHTYGGQWIDIPDVSGSERDLPMLISGADFYNQFLPAWELDEATKIYTHYLSIRVVKKSVLLDGSICVEEYYTP